MVRIAGRSRLRKKRLAPRWGDSLAPLLDVIFLLVIFLLVSARFDSTQAITVDLPEANGDVKKASRSEPLLVTLLENGELHWRGEQISPQQFSEALKELDPEQRLRPFTIRADRSVALESGIQLLEILGLLGWSQVEFEVSPAPTDLRLLEDYPSDR